MMGVGLLEGIEGRSLFFPAVGERYEIEGDGSYLDEEKTVIAIPTNDGTKTFYDVEAYKNGLRNIAIGNQENPEQAVIIEM